MEHKKKRHEVTHHKAKPREHPGTGLRMELREFHHHPKNHYWYLGIGVLFIALILVSLYLKQYLTALVFLAFAVALYRFAEVKPGLKKTEINDKGIYWGEQFFPFHKLRAFYLSFANEQVNIYLERLNLSPSIHLIIPENRTDEVLQTLSKHLPFHDHKDEPVSDKIGRLIKF